MPCDRIILIVKNIARFILRTIAIKGQDEHVDPEKKGAFQNRFEDYHHRYTFASKYVKGKKVLDIACGEGYGSKLLSKKATRVTGVDVESEAIQVAREKYGAKNRRKNTKFVCADAISFLSNSKDRFDVIVSFETVEHVKEYRKFLTLMHDRLKPGGILLLSTPNKKFFDVFFGGTYNPFHMKEFYTKELAIILERIFHTQPQVYRQGTVVRKFFVPSSLIRFFWNKSLIQKASPLTTGMGNLYVVVKNKL